MTKYYQRKYVYEKRNQLAKNFVNVYRKDAINWDTRDYVALYQTSITNQVDVIVNVF